MPHQRQIVDTALEILDPATGRHAYGTVIVTIPRQSGKTMLVHALLLAGVLSRRDYRAWYTAQTGIAARKKFREYTAAVARIRLLRQRGTKELIKVRETAGDESWAFGDSRLSLFSPQPDAIHGEATDLVVMDEAWAHTLARGRELMQAAAPSGATRPRQQIWIVSTAGDAGSEFLSDMCATGRRLATAGATSGIAYFEWSAAGAYPAGADLPQIVDAVIDAHPAVGRTVLADKVRGDLETLGLDEWLRGYGNVWTASSIRVLPADLWAAACAHGDPHPAEQPAFGIDVALDRSNACIAMAWPGDSGHARTKIAVHGTGTGWVIDELARLRAAGWTGPVAVDNFGPAVSLIDPLKRAGCNVAVMNTKAVATACGDLYDAVMQQTIRVAPNPLLDLAVEGAAKRALGDAFAWGRKTSAADITPLGATTWALWALRHGPSEPVLY